MQGRIPPSRLALPVALLLAFVPALVAQQGAPETPEKVRIGLVGTLFRDLPPAIIHTSMGPFHDLMHEQTGLSGQLLIVEDALTLGKELNENKLHLGVFHGVEFSWAQERNPNLRPLVIAINRHRQLRAHVVVKWDSQTNGFSDLKGKKVAVPRGSREHCRLYVARECRTFGATLQEYFAEVIAHPNIEDALDDVVRGKVDAAVVDGVSLESYAALKPGPFSALKQVQQSPPFPAAVVAYRQGAIDAATLDKFREGMVKANTNTRGRELMHQWRLTAFEEVPANYQQTLDDIRKQYPVPVAADPTQPTRGSGK